MENKIFAANSSGMELLLKCPQGSPNRPDIHANDQKMELDDLEGLAQQKSEYCIQLFEVQFYANGDIKRPRNATSRMESAVPGGPKPRILIGL